MVSKRTDADSPLPIKVWEEIEAITERLDRCESSYRFVPGKGDILVKEHPPELLRALRAIFEVYGERIEKELPDDLRGVDWVTLCNPTVGIYVQTRDDLFVSKVRRYQFEHLYEIAARAVAKHNAATLAGAEQGGESTETETPSPALDNHPPDPDVLVSLDDLVPVTRLNKRALERLTLPEPDRKGGRGKAHKWWYKRILPILEPLANRTMPAEYPGTRLHDPDPVEKT